MAFLPTAEEREQLKLEALRKQALDSSKDSTELSGFLSRVRKQVEANFLSGSTTVYTEHKLYEQSDAEAIVKRAQRTLGQEAGYVATTVLNNGFWGLHVSWSLD